VRWTVAEEDRHEVDRAAIGQVLAGAAEVKLEGRIVPVQRTRAAGIAQLHSLADKVRAWAELAACRPEPLLACLDQLSSKTPEDIAATVLAAATATPIDGDDSRCGAAVGVKTDTGT
jgi:exonuclease SbcD